LITLRLSHLEGSQTKRRRDIIDKVKIYGKFLTISCKHYAFNFATLASLLRVIIYITEHLSAAKIAFAFHSRDGRAREETRRISPRDHWAPAFGQWRSSRDVSSTNWKIRIRFAAGRPYGADLINCACAPRHRERNETLLSRRRIASLLYMPLLLLFPFFAAVEINRIIWSSSPASVSGKNAVSFPPLSQALSTTASNTARDVSPRIFLLSMQLLSTTVG